jgi:hypothetical protein
VEGIGSWKKVETALGCPIIRAVSSFDEKTKRFKVRCKILYFHFFRWMERRLSVRSLYWVFGGYARVRSALQRNLDSVPLPACLAVEKPAQAIRASRRQCYLNQMLEYMPERLADPK